MLELAQVSSPRTQANAGTQMAHWADKPQKTAEVWVGGIVVLIAVVVALVKLRDNKRSRAA